MPDLEQVTEWVEGYGRAWNCTAPWRRTYRPHAGGGW
jgi:hypothetical protein